MLTTLSARLTDPAATAGETPPGALPAGPDADFTASLAALASLFLIYGLIAIPLKSYSQPLVIMSVIPFGLIGAAVGHLLLGISFSMFSLFGLIALAGVVVNDSLIMIDFTNKARDSGVPARQAVVDAGIQRFRAIVLTSLTTAAGLMPIMLERSVQAQYVIPMAVSLAYFSAFTTRNLLLRILLYALCAVSAGLLLIDPLIHKHGGFAIAHWWGFYGIFGFVACVVLVLAAAWLRRIVTKPEDYYRPPQPPRDPGGLDP